MNAIPRPDIPQSKTPFIFKTVKIPKSLESQYLSKQNPISIPFFPAYRQFFKALNLSSRCIVFGANKQLVHLHLEDNSGDGISLYVTNMKSMIIATFRGMLPEGIETEKNYNVILSSKNKIILSESGLPFPPYRKLIPELDGTCFFSGESPDKNKNAGMIYQIIYKNTQADECVDPKYLDPILPYGVWVQARRKESFCVPLRLDLTIEAVRVTLVIMPFRT